jgi:hypothetical protein
MVDAQLEALVVHEVEGEVMEEGQGEEELLTGFMIAEMKYASPEIQKQDQRTRKATTMPRCGFLVDLGCARAPCIFPGSLASLR